MRPSNFAASFATVSGGIERTARALASAHGERPVAFALIKAAFGLIADLHDISRGTDAVYMEVMDVASVLDEVCHQGASDAQLIAALAKIPADLVEVGVELTDAGRQALAEAGGVR